MSDGCNYVEEASKAMLMGMAAIAATIPPDQFEAWADDMAFRVATLAEKTHAYIHPPEEEPDDSARDP